MGWLQWRLWSHVRGQTCRLPGIEDKLLSYKYVTYLSYCTGPSPIHPFGEEIIQACHQIQVGLLSPQAVQRENARDKFQH